LLQQAIGVLLAERQTIDQKLVLLGHDGIYPGGATKLKACHRERQLRAQLSVSQEASAGSQEASDPV
jgi:hypothetical protein